MEREVLMSVMSMFVLETVEELMDGETKKPTKELQAHLEAMRHFCEHTNSVMSQFMAKSTAKQEYENAIMYHTKKFITKINREEKKQKRNESKRIF